MYYGESRHRNLKIFPFITKQTSQIGIGVGSEKFHTNQVYPNLQFPKDS